VQLLRETYRDYGNGSADRKIRLLRDVADRVPHDLRSLLKLHDLTCFLSAFPDSVVVARWARAARDAVVARVATLPHGVRRSLNNSGLPGTVLAHEYGWQDLSWLSRVSPGRIEFDWSNCDTNILDAALRCLVTLSEQDGFDGGTLSSRDWIRMAKGQAGGTDLDWVVAQLQGANSSLDTSDASFPVLWDLDRSHLSRSFNALAASRVVPRSGGLRRSCRYPKRQILKPLAGVKRLSPTAGQAAVMVVRAALAVRRREVHALTYPNPAEVYSAPLGCGTELIIVGVEPEQRLTLEGNYGYVILASGVPIGYGGVSPLYAQANTGINIFEEFRGSEAAFLFIQVLRTFHTLFGSARFLVSAYQFGEDNTEAVASGAFWFYYRLGFRPVDRSVRQLARSAWGAVVAGQKTPAPVLRDLASSDMELQLVRSGPRRFDERDLETCSVGATRLIAREGCDRRTAVARVAARVARRLGTGPRRYWPKCERRSFNQLAAIIALHPNLAALGRRQRQSLVAAMRSKGRIRELEYVGRMSRQDELFCELARFAQHHTLHAIR
jgi:hypothetical protein